MQKKACIFALFVSALVGGHVVSAQPVSPLASTMTDQEREFLRRAMSETPYSALVIHTKVEILPMRGKKKSKQPSDVVTEESHIYHARVLETFRGTVQTQIRYEIIVEPGEGAGISSQPNIVTLCRDSGGLYWWPGPGATLDGTPVKVAEARRVGKQLASSKSRSFKDCQ